MICVSLLATSFTFIAILNISLWVVSCCLISWIFSCRIISCYTTKNTYDNVTYAGQHYNITLQIHTVTPLCTLSVTTRDLGNTNSSILCTHQQHSNQRKKCTKLLLSTIESKHQLSTDMGQNGSKKVCYITLSLWSVMFMILLLTEDQFNLLKSEEILVAFSQFLPRITDNTLDVFLSTQVLIVKFLYLSSVLLQCVV